jgi:hypothetical protein
MFGVHALACLAAASRANRMAHTDHPRPAKSESLPLACAWPTSHRRPPQPRNSAFLGDFKPFQAFSSLFKGKKIVFARQGHQTMAKASISHLQSPNLAGAPNRG